MVPTSRSRFIACPGAKVFVLLHEIVRERTSWDKGTRMMNDSTLSVDAVMSHVYPTDLSKSGREVMSRY
jgi:hypothetical protein